MQPEKSHQVNDVVLKEIIRSLESIKYCQVQITVHNSKVVQIDKIEKTRFDENLSNEPRE